MSDRALVVDAVVASVAYTTHCILAVNLLFKIYTHRERAHRWKHLALVSTFLVLGSVQAIAYLHFNFSGGLRRLLDFFHASLGIPNENAASSPPSAEAHRSDVTIQYLNGLSALFVTWVANGFMLYRCFIIWSKEAWVLLILPSLLYMAIIGNGIFGIYNLVQADNAKGTSIFMRLHWSLSLSTNALISALIVVRLLLAMHKMRRVSGHSKGRNAPYLGIIAIVTESSLLYTLVVGIAYPIYGPTAWLFQYTRATENMVNPLLVQTECIAAEIIVLRFVRGRSWNSATFTTVQTTESDVENRATAGAVFSTHQSHSENPNSTLLSLSKSQAVIDLQPLPPSEIMSNAKSGWR